MKNKIFDNGFIAHGVLNLSPSDSLELCKKEAVIVDVRENYMNEFKVFNVPKVIYMPLSEIRKTFNQLPDDIPLIFADAVGLRSRESVLFMNEHGYDNVANMAGGIVDWERDGLPLTTDITARLSGSCMCQLKPREGEKKKEGEKRGRGDKESRVLGTTQFRKAERGEKEINVNSKLFITMKTISVGFIGGGRVAKILLQAFKNKNAGFSKIIVTDTNADVLANLKKAYPEIQTGDAGTAAEQEIVFIALHPPVVMDTLELIKGRVKNDAIFISLAPKINIVKLSSKLEQVKNIARLIPNATSYINEGYNPVTFSSGFDSKKKQEVMDMLKILGNTFEVCEEKLESYAIMSAMLPTYFWFQWRELAEIGGKIGLTEEESKKSIHDTIIASLDLMYKSGLTPAEVIDLIPVKPIGEHEPQIVEIYKTKLIGLFEKIKP